MDLGFPPVGTTVRSQKYGSSQKLGAEIHQWNRPYINGFYNV